MKSLIIFVMIVNLWTSANCVTFSCTFKMNTWFVVGNIYTCYEAKVLLSNETELKQVTGQYEIGKSDANVEALHVYKTSFPFIPTKIETFFPNLLAIRIYQTNLKVLTNNDLRPFPMLKLFMSYNNLIESLDGDVFDNNIQLERVDIWSNKLVNVGLNLLDKLTKLQRAFFKGNPCIDFDAITPAEIAQLKQKLIDQCPPKATTTSKTTTSTPTCGLIEEISLCDKEISFLIDLKVAASQTQKQVTKIEQQTENANMKQALEIVELQGENEALKTQMKELKAQIEGIQRLFVNLRNLIVE